MPKVTAKKSLGQHFLTSGAVADRIVGSLPAAAQGAMPTLEVGPGMGILTERLLRRSDLDLHCVELDPESVDYLRLHYPTLLGRLTQADFLRLDLQEIFGGRDFWLIGNFPYNISSQIFFRVLEARQRIPCVVGMLQKEVAQRLAAPPAGRERGILSVLLQTFYRVEYLFEVGHSLFDPPPQVESAVVRLTRNDFQLGEEEFQKLLRVVKAAFNQRRKMLRNSLAAAGYDLQRVPPDWLTLRPERLSTEQFILLKSLVFSR